MESEFNPTDVPLKDRPTLSLEEVISLGSRNIGERFYIPQTTLGYGTGRSTVQTCPIYYEQDTTGSYQRHESPSAVIKNVPLANVFKSQISVAHGNKDPNFIKEKFDERLTHECEMLKRYGDPEAAIQVGKNSVLLKMSKAQGLPIALFMEKNKVTSFDERMALAKKIADALADLHEKKVAHLDLKSENIYYDGERITFVDFGSARSTDDNLASLPGYLHKTTDLYDPPDHNDSTPIQVDTYSLAGVLNELMGGKGYDFASIPNAGLNEQQQRERAIMIGALTRMANPDHSQRLPYQEAYLEAQNHYQKSQAAQSVQPAEYPSQPPRNAQPAQISGEPQKAYSDVVREKHAETLKTWFLVNEKDLKSSQKSKVKILNAFMTSKDYKTKFDEKNMIDMLNAALDEAVHKQATPQLSLGFIKIDKLGGSNVLRAILKLPEEVKQQLNSENLVKAERLSKNIFQRKETAVELPEVKASDIKPPR